MLRNVIDINPFKQGKYLPGAAFRVSTPEALVDDPPNTMIVMDPVYLEEISGRLRSMGPSLELAEA